METGKRLTIATVLAALLIVIVLVAFTNIEFELTITNKNAEVKGNTETIVTQKEQGTSNETPHADILSAIASQKEYSVFITATSDNETNNEAYYRYVMSKHSSGLADALGELEEVLKRYESSLISVNGIIVANDAWTGELAAKIQGVFRYTNEAQYINAPVKFMAMHELYIQGINKYREAMKQLIQGVNINDSAAIERFNSLMIEGAALIQKAAETAGEISGENIRV
jgi:hypothetical protein